MIKKVKVNLKSEASMPCLRAACAPTGFPHSIGGSEGRPWAFQNKRASTTCVQLGCANAGLPHKLTLHCPLCG